MNTTSRDNHWNQPSTFKRANLYQHREVEQETGGVETPPPLIREVPKWITNWLWRKLLGFAMIHLNNWTVWLHHHCRVAALQNIGRHPLFNLLPNRKNGMNPNWKRDKITRKTLTSKHRIVSERVPFRTHSRLCAALEPSKRLRCFLLGGTWHVERATSASLSYRGCPKPRCPWQTPADSHTSPYK